MNRIRTIKKGDVVLIAAVVREIGNHDDEYLVSVEDRNGKRIQNVWIDTKDLLPVPPTKKARKK